ncbi:MAG TPA: kelch repeat-containing protein, partial [Anaerolineales bacterium]|nr:kelch repeat-containing protein [Anaerolineales bacterium]
IIEYSPDAPAFCGRLGGDLLISYFSQSDQIQRLKLSPDGSRVVWDKALIRSSAGTGGKTLSNPLPITQDPAGRIYVGEFGFDQVTVFEPVNIGLWTSFGLTNQPAALLDAGGAALDGKLYVVGGKSESGHQSSLYAYQPISNTWQTLASLPAEYPGVENLAVAPYNGQLYVFGGSTEAFAGAVNKAAVYDPATDAWTLLPDMPTARGGVTAQTLGDEIYVIGGLGENGDSLATVEIFTPATGAWRAGDSLLTPRDNPGSAVFDGKLYVFGGRTRIGGDNVEPTLNTIEIFTPGVGWETGTPMPSGRRTMSVVVLNGEIIVMGGEKTPEGGAFQVTEAYDPVNDRWRLLTMMPVGRHGAVAGVIGNTAYVAGGGAEGGTSFSADIDAFYFDCDAVVPTSVRFAEPSIIGAPTSMSQLIGFLKSGFGFTDAGAETISFTARAPLNLNTE